MKAVLRSLKDEWNDYTDGERIVRELTSNDDVAPTVPQLKRLVYLLNNPKGDEFQKSYRCLIKRCIDWRYLRHMEKGLIVAEYLLKHANNRYVRTCRVNMKHFNRLTTMKYELYGRDYGGNVRRRAKRIVQYLEDHDRLENARAKAQGAKYKRVANKKQKATTTKPTAKKKGVPDKSSTLKPSSQKKRTERKKSHKSKSKSKKSESGSSSQLSESKEAEGPVEGDLLGDLFGAPMAVSQPGASGTAGVVSDDTFFEDFVVDDFGPSEMVAEEGMPQANVAWDFEGGFDDDPFAEDFDPLTDDNVAGADGGDPVSADSWLNAFTKMDDPLSGDVMSTQKPTATKKGKKTMKELAAQQGNTLPLTFDSTFMATSTAPGKSVAGGGLGGGLFSHGPTRPAQQNDIFASLATTSTATGASATKPVPATYRKQDADKDPFADLGIF